MTYTIDWRNRLPFQYEDALFFDPINPALTFSGANIDIGDGIIFYNEVDLWTDLTAGGSVPLFDTNALPTGLGGNWTTSPTVPSNVTWVALYVPTNGSALVEDSNSRVRMRITTRLPQATGDNCCETLTIPPNCMTSTVRRVIDMTDTNNPVAPMDDCVANFGGIGCTRFPCEIRPPQAAIRSGINCDPAVTILPGDAQINVEVCNDPSTPLPDVMTNSIVTLSWTPVDINGTLVYPTYAGHTVMPSGGRLLSYDPGNGTVQIELGPIDIGACRQIAMDLQFPAGLAIDSAYTVNAQIQGFTACNACPVATRLHEIECRVIGAPDIRVIKNDIQNLIASGDCLTYSLTAENIGEFPSHNTWVVDRIPNNMVHSLACNPTGNQVWFSNKLPPDLPLAFSIVEPFDFTYISDNFTLGTDVGGGCWDQPAGWTTEEVTYVAFLVDDPVANEFDVGSSIDLTWEVCNDHDQAGPSTNGSPDLTVVYNTTVIFSDENIQAFANRVKTTIITHPLLEFEKTGPDVATAGEVFDWIIEYRNVGSEGVTNVVFRDLLPEGVTFITASQQLFDVTDGTNVGPLVTLVNGADGFTTPDGSNLTFDVSGDPGDAHSFLSGPLPVDRGGRIYITVRVNDDVPNNTVLLNRVEGDFDIYCCIEEEHPVTVKKPDLYLTKLVDNTQPLVDDILLYYVQVQNVGDGFATNVMLTDTLPTGLNFLGMESISPADYSIGVPVQTPEAGGTELRWSVADGNALTSPDGPGIIEGGSPPIYISYRVQVVSPAQPGDVLANYACITNDIPEDPNRPNDDEAPVEIPFPELGISKSGPGLVEDGSTYAYTIRWINNNPAAAPDVFILEELPTNVTFISTIADPSVTQVYYNATYPCPAFDIHDNASNAANGWVTTTPPTPTYCIVYAIGTVPAFGAGYQNQVTVQAVNPLTGEELGDGVSIMNHVTITQPPGDPDPSNNVDWVTTETPGQDMAVRKVGDPEGVFPGALPGDDITYTIEFENVGPVDACGIRITEIWPDIFGIPSAANGFSNLTLTIVDENGLETDFVQMDTDGTVTIDPVMGLLTLNGQEATWEFDNPGVPNNEICMPPGAVGRITLTATIPENAEDMVQIENIAWVDITETNTYYPNDTGTTEVVVYRADVTVEKSVVDGGRQAGQGSLVPDNPVGSIIYLPLEADVLDQGDDATDHNGAPAPGPARYLEGIRGNMLCFNASNGDLVEFADNGAINTGGSKPHKSIAMWACPDTVSGTRWLYKQGGTGSGFGLYLSNGQLRSAAWFGNADLASERSYAGPVPIAAGTCVHVAMVYDNTTGTHTLYTNGVVAATTTTVGAIPAHTGDASLGGADSNARLVNGSSNQGDFDGCLDEFAYYNRPLSASEIAALVALPLGGATGSPGGSELLTDQGNKLVYTIRYDNIGSTDAENTIIREIVPEGTKILPDSFVGLPDGATVTYDADPPEDATAFEVNLGTLPSPAGITREALTDEFTGSHLGTRVLGTASATSGGSGTGTVIPGLLGGDLTDPENDGVDVHMDPLGINFNVNQFFTSDASRPNFRTGGGGGGNHGAYDIFDNKRGNGSEKYCCSAAPQTIGFELTDPVVLSHFTLTSNHDSLGRNPDHFRIEGSNDGSTWSTIFEYSNDGPASNNRGDGDTTPWTANNQVRLWTSTAAPIDIEGLDTDGPDFPTPPAYRFFRINMLSPGGWQGTGGQLSLAEMELFAAPLAITTATGPSASDWEPITTTDL